MSCQSSGEQAKLLKRSSWTPSTWRIAVVLKERRSRLSHRRLGSIPLPMVTIRRPQGQIGGSVVHMPSGRAALRHAVPIVTEALVAPLVLFYSVLLLAGFRGALVAALAWSYLALGRRIWRAERVSTLLGLGALLLTVRTVVSFVTGSAFIYFAQPLLGTVLIALALLGSAFLGRPFTQRFAHDFCPIDPELIARPHVRQFFVRISVMWAAVLLINVGMVLWLLVSSSLRSFVLERTAVTWGLTAAAIFSSVVGFTTMMRSHGFAVQWGGGVIHRARARGVDDDENRLALEAKALHG